MSVKSGQAAVAMFTTYSPTTGAASYADSVPIGKLYVNGTADATSVTATSLTTGLYKLTATLPTLAAGDFVALGASLAVLGVAVRGIVWQDVADTVRLSDGVTVNSIAANVITATAVTTSAGAEIRTGLLTTASYTTPPNVAAIADAVWDEAAAGHATVGSAGLYLYNSWYSANAAASDLANTTDGLGALKAIMDTSGVVVAANGLTATSLTTSAAAEIRTGLLTTASYTTPPTVAAITASIDKTGYALTASYDAAKYATMSTVWTDTKAGYVDAAVTSRAAAATALSTATWTHAKAGYLTGNVALAASLTTANTNIAAVLADTGTDGVVVATASKNAIADQVWDEAIADHVTAGTAGRFLQRVYRYFFNKRAHTNSSVVVYADDGTTADATMVVSGDTTTVTKAAPS